MNPIPNDYARFAGLGLQFGATLLLFGALGWWLDAKFGTSPWLLITGLFTGAGIAFYALIRAIPPSKPPRRS
jgi:ATP synthase protein I